MRGRTGRRKGALRRFAALSSPSGHENSALTVPAAPGGQERGKSGCGRPSRCVLQSLGHFRLSREQDADAALTGACAVPVVFEGELCVQSGGTARPGPRRGPLCPLHCRVCRSLGQSHGGNSSPSLEGRAQNHIREGAAGNVRARPQLWCWR